MKKPHKEKDKVYIVRKYIKATDVKQALRKESATPVHDVYVSDDWGKEHLSYAIGFDNGVDQDEELED